MINSRNDITGQVFNGIQVIKEPGEGTVIGKCIICNTDSEYNKHRLTYQGTKCKNCGLAVNYAGQIINNIKIINFAYTGKDKNKYYNCACNKCGESLILTREEILKYICTKEH